MYLSSTGTPRNGFSNQTPLARKENREENPTKIPCCEGGWTISLQRHLFSVGYNPRDQ